MGERIGEEDVTDGPRADHGAAPAGECALCDTAVGDIVECDAYVILIRRGAGLCLAPRR